MANYYEVPPGGSPQTAPNSSLALISLISGILGLTFVPFLGSIVAVITGPMARREIRESGGTLGGENLATVGIVLGWIGIALGILGLCGVGIAVLLPFCLLMWGTSVDVSGLLFPALLAFL